MDRDSEEMAQHIKDTYRYDPETGKIYWRGRYEGKEAFKTKQSEGYLVGEVFGKQYFTHRVAWLLYYGEWPQGQIDHVNGVRADNRIENLRVVSNQENQRNSSLRSNNTSGVIGVYWSKQSCKWRAQIKAFGKNRSLGYFDHFDDAVAARKEAGAKYGYHENHGKDLTIGKDLLTNRQDMCK